MPRRPPPFQIGQYVRCRGVAVFAYHAPPGENPAAEGERQRLLSVTAREFCGWIVGARDRYEGVFHEEFEDDDVRGGKYSVLRELQCRRRVRVWLVTEGLLNVPVEVLEAEIVDVLPPPPRQPWRKGEPWGGGQDTATLLPPRDERGKFRKGR